MHLFVLVLKPVGWGHNALELLPWAALLAAAAVERTVAAFAADRRELVTNFEIAGWMHDLLGHARREGMAAPVRDRHRLRRGDSFEVVDRSLAATADAAVAAVRRRRLAVVVTPHRPEHSPGLPFALDPGLLHGSGYRPVGSTPAYTVWARVPPAAGLETRPGSP